MACVHRYSFSTYSWCKHIDIASSDAYRWRISPFGLSGSFCACIARFEHSSPSLIFSSAMFWVRRSGVTESVSLVFRKLLIVERCINAFIANVLPGNRDDHLSLCTTLLKWRRALLLNTDSTLWVKKGLYTFAHNFGMTDFRNFSIVELIKKFATNWLSH